VVADKAHKILVVALHLIQFLVLAIVVIVLVIMVLTLVLLENLVGSV
jgi:hypothetical protein